MGINVKEYSDNFAYDISKNVVSKGEVHNHEVLNQSIELILSTGFNERLFNPTFGSVLPSYLFDFINEKTGEKLLDDCIAAVHKWEDRIIIISSQARIQILDDQYVIILTLPYVVKQNGVGGIFKKKINF